MTTTPLRRQTTLRSALLLVALTGSIAAGACGDGEIVAPHHASRGDAGDAGAAGTGDASGNGGASGLGGAAGKVGAAGALGAAGAAGAPGAGAAGAPENDNGPQDDLGSIEWKPSFEPDYNTMVAQPWVEPVTKAQADDVDVLPSTLRFKSTDHPEVSSWSAGRVVVSAPGEGKGKNPLGFARRVVDVTDDGTTITVETVLVGLEDLVTGEMQMVLDQSKVKEVDISKLDLEWAAKNLYQDYDVLALPEANPLRDDEPTVWLDEDGNPLPGSDPGIGSTFKKLGKKIKHAATTAANAVAHTATELWQRTTPESIQGSANFNPEFRFDNSEGLFDLAGGFEQTFSNGKYPIALFIDGSAQVGASLKFNPGLQIGVKVPFPGHSSKPSAWLNFDSRIETGLKFTLDLEAGLRSADNTTGSELTQRLKDDADFASDVLGHAKKELLGSPDLKPAGGWKRTLYVSRPATQTVVVDVVPIVFTETFQLDLECGFEAKASARAVIDLRQASSFKFGVRSENGRATITEQPSFDIAKRQTLQVTGGGEASISCGLIPRVNAYVYDLIGIFAGVRHSLVARAAFTSTCEPDPVETTPEGDVALSLKGSVGVQVGARLEAPGSSFAGSAGTVAGVDVGAEVWHREYDIYSKSFSVGAGLGYCTPGCRDGKQSFAETDTDCGGGQCAACDLDDACQWNSDCRVGYCSGGTCGTKSCGDGVQDGDETDVDCGGGCGKCSAGAACLGGSDCDSDFCRREYAAEGTCIDDHCQDGSQDADESGVDCGGAQCAKCANFATCSTPEDCESGISDGLYCVTSDCSNREQDGLESDVDCGGDDTCRRCGAGESCQSRGDCSSAAQSCVFDSGADLGTCTDLCHNGVNDDDEGDTDCAAHCPVRCAEGQGCNDQSDCADDLLCNLDTTTCEVAP